MDSRVKYLWQKSGTFSTNANVRDFMWGSKAQRPTRECPSERTWPWTRAETHDASCIYNAWHTAFVQRPLFVKTLTKASYLQSLFFVTQYRLWIVNALLHRTALTTLLAQLLTKYSFMAEMAGIYICVCVYIYFFLVRKSFCNKGKLYKKSVDILNSQKLNLFSFKIILYVL